MVPRDGRGPPTNSDEYYFAIRDLFPHVPTENDVLGRLLCFALRMCQLRIEKNPNPTAQEVRDACKGNFCRCGTYPRIFEAALAAAKNVTGDG